MSSPADLVSLAALKGWLGVQSSADDALLSTLISSASRAILGYLGRSTILPANYDERYDGRGTYRLILRRFPVLSVTSLSINGVPIAKAAAPEQFGFYARPWSGDIPGELGVVSLMGLSFPRLRDGVSVQYSAGYQLAEFCAVPAIPYTYAVLAPFGAWASDAGVTYAASGLPLTAVTGTPSAGQYKVAAGVYTFAAADVGLGVQIAYGFVPHALAQACMEMAAERYRYKDRIGNRSKSIGGQETVSYDLGNAFSGGAGAGAGMTSIVLGLLQPFKAVVPPLF